MIGPKHIFVVAFIGLLLLLASFVFLPQVIRARITENEIARYFLPTYRSLRKLPDIVFTPYLFTKTDLESIEIVVDQKDILTLNEALPTSSPFTSISLDQNRTFVKALFRGGSYEDEVEVRYKGLSSNHWNSFKKSYRVRFPEDHLYQNGSALNLVIPDDKAYYADILNAYRAEKLGLLTPHTRLTNVTINGQNHGVFLTSDQWSTLFLEGRRIPESSNILGLNDGSFSDNSGISYESVSAFSPAYAQVWKSYTSEEAEGNFEEIHVLLNLLAYADDATFEKLIPHIIDLENFYRWDIVNVLAGNPVVDYENLLLIFNTATGKFEFSPIDTYIVPVSSGYTEQSKLVRRILSIDTFKTQRDNVLRAYIENKENLAGDLAFYDNLYADTRNEFFKDHVKRENNFTYIKRVHEARDIFADNFEKAAAVFNVDYRALLDEQERQLFSFTGSFERFAEIGFTREQFLARNPQFKARGSGAVVLLSGRYYFSNTVIVPENLEVIIDPGVSLYFGKNVSLLSYSSIRAVGTAAQPIVVRRAFPEKAWGTVASVGEPSATSIVEHVSFDGGSGALLNGIIFTGMVAFHNTNAEVRDTSFFNAVDDDALNVKYGHVVIERALFSRNSSDAIDLDFATSDSKVVSNTFTDNGHSGGGDAIDLSWSDVTIADNVIDGCTDKGVSVGEKSKPTIESNTISNCPIGIAVKDLSEGQIIGNTIRYTKIGISAYQKKQTFGGGIAHVSRNVFEDVATPYEADSVSKIVPLD